MWIKGLRVCRDKKWASFAKVNARTRSLARQSGLDPPKFKLKRKFLKHATCSSLRTLVLVEDLQIKSRNSKNVENLKYCIWLTIHNFSTKLAAYVQCLVDDKIWFVRLALLNINLNILIWNYKIHISQLLFQIVNSVYFHSVFFLRLTILVVCSVLRTLFLWLSQPSVSHLTLTLSQSW